jgi:hypothetical protein
VLPPSPSKTGALTAAAMTSKASPEKPVRKKKAADGMWAEITRYNAELAVIEEEEQKERHAKRREDFSHTLESQVEEQRRLKAESDAKARLFVCALLCCLALVKPRLCRKLRLLRNKLVSCVPGRSKSAKLRRLWQQSAHESRQTL